ncbi:MAG TPA: hypothetical protein PL093_00145 [Candidatus Pacearchaeota archaeon]|nr:hypothetical protein [Candidatus Pacearchaeota archaeon]HQG09454.1 hypothetical protein [Candidatus Pacearchaeota archaeon]HQH19974.1 hypothetical protein [Candidatus Pacearchaeota archaeon]HQK58438.1 hypothetical protein [Candidatus Pacearchaeota archaeon]
MNIKKIKTHFFVLGFLLVCGGIFLASHLVFIQAAPSPTIKITSAETFYNESTSTYKVTVSANVSEAANIIYIIVKAQSINGEDYNGYSNFSIILNTATQSNNSNIFSGSTNISPASINRTWKLTVSAYSTNGADMIPYPDNNQFLLTINAMANSDASMMPVCGAAIQTPTAVAPTENLCKQGNATTPKLDSTKTLWHWTCYQSLNNSFLIDCYAGTIGQCGLASSKFYSNKPTEELCSVGIASEANQNSTGQWTWTCTGKKPVGSSQTNTESQDCTSLAASNITSAEPVCGIATQTPTTEAPMENLCKQGNATTPILDIINSKWDWACREEEKEINCSAPFINQEPQQEQQSQEETQISPEPQGVSQVDCIYTYSKWSDCENGFQTRIIISKTPDGCRENLTEPLEQQCSSPKNCAFTYSEWSECKDGKRTRSVIQNYSDCSFSEAITVERCVASETNETSVQTPSQTPSQTPNLTQPSSGATSSQETLDPLCKIAQITTPADCQIYLYQTKIKVSKECLDNNLVTKDQCRQYFFSKYGQPLKCKNLDENKCNFLITEVILSDFVAPLPVEDKTKLVESAGKTAIIDTPAQTVVIPPAKTQVVPVQVKLEILPLSPNNGEVGVSLLKTNLTKEQENILVPVAIALDSNQNGIPDDIEARLNIKSKDLKEIDISKLGGVDKAILNNQPLEQPKLNDQVKTTDSLTIEKIESLETVGSELSANILRFKGKADPNEIITLFIYSPMPIVLTVKTDQNGNWIYDLDKSLTNGKHEAYVAINNDTGRLVEASAPKPFFIQEAKAVSLDEYVGITDASSVPDQTKISIFFYILGGLIIILIMVVIFLIVRQKIMKEQ